MFQYYHLVSKFQIETKKPPWNKPYLAPKAFMCFFFLCTTTAFFASIVSPSSSVSTSRPCRAGGRPPDQSVSRHISTPPLSQGEHQVPEGYNSHFNIQFFVPRGVRVAKPDVFKNNRTILILFHNWFATKSHSIAPQRSAFQNEKTLQSVPQHQKISVFRIDIHAVPDRRWFFFWMPNILLFTFVSPPRSSSVIFVFDRRIFLPTPMQASF